MTLFLGAKKIIAGNSGQAMVEMAIVALLFFMLIYGILEFGRYWFYSTHLVNSVRAAARYGAVLPDPATVVSNTKTYATQEISAHIPDTDGGGLMVTVNAPAKHGDIIRVQATYNFQVLAGTIIPGTGFSGTIPMTREASSNYE